MTIKLSYTEREYVRSQFMRYIEKRVRKDIRLNKDIEPLDTIYLYNDGSKEYKVAKHFLERVFGDNLTVKGTEKKESKDGKLVIPMNMDRYVTENLRKFLSNSYEKEERILILDNVLEEEIVKICDILDIEAEESEETDYLIQEMEKKYPDTKFSLHSSFQELQQRLF